MSTTGKIVPVVQIKRNKTLKSIQQNKTNSFGINSFTLYLQSISKCQWVQTTVIFMWKNSFLPGLWFSFLSIESSQSGVYYVSPINIFFSPMVSISLKGNKNSRRFTASFFKSCPLILTLCAL